MIVPGFGLYAPAPELGASREAPLSFLLLGTIHLTLVCGWGPFLLWHPSSEMSFLLKFFCSHRLLARRH